jgi:hypothetical protein
LQDILVVSVNLGEHAPCEYPDDIARMLAIVFMIKLFAFELAGEILQVRGKSRSTTTFVQRVKRSSQTA